MNILLLISVFVTVIVLQMPSNSRKLLNDSHHIISLLKLLNWIYSLIIEEPMSIYSTLQGHYKYYKQMDADILLCTPLVTGN